MKNAGRITAGVVLLLVVLSSAVALAIYYATSIPSSSLPLASVTFEEMPPSSTQNEGAVVIEAVLDLKGRRELDAKARMAWIEGKYKRLPAEGGTLAVEGDTCRMTVKLRQSEYWNAFGLLGHDPVIRIGITTADGREWKTVGTLHRKQEFPR